MRLVDLAKNRTCNSKWMPTRAELIVLFVSFPPSLPPSLPPSISHLNAVAFTYGAHFFFF